MHMMEKIMANVEMGVDRDGESIKQRFVAEKHSANGLFLVACFRTNGLGEFPSLQFANLRGELAFLGYLVIPRKRDQILLEQDIKSVLGHGVPISLS
jgi:hypothetical protein